MQVDILDAASGIFVLIGQPGDGDILQPVFGGLGRVGNLRQVTGDIHRGVFHQRQRFRALQQGDHARQGHAGLFIPGHQHAQSWQ